MHPQFWCSIVGQKGASYAYTGGYGTFFPNSSDETGHTLPAAASRLSPLHPVIVCHMEIPFRTDVFAA